MGKPVAAALNPTLSAPISFVQLPKYPIVACFSSLCKCDWCKKIKYLASYLETQNFILIISSEGGGGRGEGRRPLCGSMLKSTLEQAPTCGGEFTCPWPPATPPPAAGETGGGRETDC